MVLANIHNSVIAGLTRNPMNRGWRIKSVMTVLLFVNSLSAQTIIEDLRSHHVSEGVISIDAEWGINALIGKPGLVINDDTDEAVKFTELSGFRIQVSMGNSRSETQAKQSEIQQTYPKLATYLIYEAPNWKLFAGDFITREEANMVKKQLQQAFPKFGKALYVVISKIKVPVE
ncbi:hypothetical protein FACS1894162_0450 [Bacteroidia bacterium]|nr:hypothetical protein FACS1894162_0450 [Bacteroidia bacterium]